MSIEMESRGENKSPQIKQNKTGFQFMAKEKLKILVTKPGKSSVVFG